MCAEGRKKKKEKEANYRGGNYSSQNGHTEVCFIIVFLQTFKTFGKKKKRVRETKKENRHLQPSPGTPKSSQMKPFFEHEECSYPASHGPGPTAPQWV